MARDYYIIPITFAPYNVVVLASTSWMYNQINRGSANGGAFVH